MTPASSLWSQKDLCQPKEGHFHTWDSFPMQFTSLSQMGPDPAPKWAEVMAFRATPQPSCLHTTWASLRSQLSSQMVPHVSWWRISILPAQWLLPPTRRSSGLSEERESYQWLPLDRELEKFSGLLRHTQWSFGQHPTLRLQSPLGRHWIIAPNISWGWIPMEIEVIRGLAGLKKKKKNWN
jgi:hypothetical protein